VIPFSVRVIADVFVSHLFRQYVIVHFFPTEINSSDASEMAHPHFLRQSPDLQTDHTAHEFFHADSSSYYKFHSLLKE
jgi:hypothetical protein